MEKNNYILIADNAALVTAIAHFRKFPLLALDLEMENNLHHYGLHVALIQISTPDGANFIIDPLTGLDVTELGKLLTDPNVELILHDSDFDRRTCYEIYGWRLTKLFDTKLAAQFCGFRQFGLAPLLQALFGITTNKKFQRLDWMRRPLREDALEYASSDTRHLFALRQTLLDRLTSLGRLEWVHEEFIRLEQDVERHDRLAPHYRIKGSPKLTGRQLALLAALVKFRDNMARSMDRPAGFLIPDRTLLEWAVSPPTTKASLQVPRVTRALLHPARKDALFRAIKSGTHATEDHHPKWRRNPPPCRGHDKRLKFLQAWRAEKATSFDMEPYLLLPNDILIWRARFPEQPFPDHISDQLRNWQRSLLWDEFETVSSSSGFEQLNLAL